MQLSPARALSKGEIGGLSSDDLRRTSGVAVEHAAVGAWTMPGVGELKRALCQEPVLAAALSAVGPEEAERWVGSLHRAIADATHDSGAPGAKLYMRFPMAYGKISHVAFGTTFREPDAELRVCFLHQESIPDVDPEGKPTKTATGRFYSTFKTEGDLPSRRSPIAESIKRKGLPFINVEACVRPGDLPQIIKALQLGVGDHVYAPSSTWEGVAEGKNAGKPHYGTCFETTDVASRGVDGGPVVWPHGHDVSESFRALAPHIGIDLAKFSTIKIGSKQVPLGEAYKQGQRAEMLAFKKMGEGWGGDAPWHVQPQDTVADRARPGIDAEIDAISKSLGVQEAKLRSVAPGPDGSVPAA